MHAFTPDGTPLGTIQAIPWRATMTRPRNATKTRAQRAAEPIEEKESYRWLLSMQRARAEAARCPGTQLVFVADSESDIYDVIAEGMEPPGRRRLDHPLLPGSRRWSTTWRTGTCWTTFARSSWRRRCWTSGRSRSAVGRRRWPARTGAAASRGCRERRSSRSGPRGHPPRPGASRPGNWPMSRSTPCWSPRSIRRRAMSRWSGSC